MPSETTPNCPTCGSEMRERELYVNEPPALECVQCRTRIYPHEMRTTPALATPPLAALTAERDALAKRCEKAEAVVGQLPVTADGVPIVPGMTVYVVAHDGVTDECAVDGVNKYRVTYKRPDIRGYVGAKRSACYSTRAAAESAAGKGSVES